MGNLMAEGLRSSTEVDERGGLQSWTPGRLGCEGRGALSVPCRQALRMAPEPNDAPVKRKSAGDGLYVVVIALLCTHRKNVIP
jgi:hypothetical protein